MADSRFHDLRDVLSYEGLNVDETNHGFDLLEGPADRCESYATLLRGALADRGQLLDNPKTWQRRGLVSGAKLITRLLADHKGGHLANEDVNRGLLAITKPGQTCDGLLAMYLKTRRYVAQRQAA